jgi:DNA-binding transcriptional ArsR family regulator
MSEARVAGGAGRLSTHLAASLDPSPQDALDHPLRRELLRVLQAREGARGLIEILSELFPFSRSEVSYHLLILQRCGFVTIEGTRPGFAAREHLYASTLQDDAQVAAVLRATAESDRELRREKVGRRSPGFLTMFRIPRPVRTISLGPRPRTGLDR